MENKDELAYSISISTRFSVPFCTAEAGKLKTTYMIRLPGRNILRFCLKDIFEI